MGGLDHAPAGGKQYKADPQYAQKIKQGALKADMIRQEAMKHHHEKDVPSAEAELQKALEAMDKNNKNKK